MPIPSIITGMRRFLSLFMMLLALRGLAGDAMALESPSAHAPAHMATMAAAHGAHASGDEQHAAHHGAADHASARAAHCGSADTDDCGSHDRQCTTCGLCHTAMDQAHSATFAGPAPASSQAPHGADRFASIAPAAQIKPPISAV